MGLLSYVNGVITSFGNSSAVVTVAPGSEDKLDRILIELKVTNELLRAGLQLDTVSLEELRGDVGDGE